MIVILVYNISMKECVNYQKAANQTLECQNCNHFCKIKEGNVGVCGVRQNIDGKLYLLVYGKAAAVNIDPIEKKPFFHFLPRTEAYSFGTVGCNFRCANCQNFDISQIYNVKGKVGEYEKVNFGYSIMPEEIVKGALESGCKSIAYTYTEPTIFMEYCLDTMKLGRKKGLKNVWVSNGFMSDKTLDLIIPYLDAINVDIKSLDDYFYKSNCGATIGPILENCRKLVEKKVWLEVTTLVIPTLSDSEKNFHKIARFIKEELGDFVPWHVSAFSGAISWRLKNIPDTPLKTIVKACEIGKKEGLKYVYAGNVWGSDMENTFCPKCGKAVVKRINYEVMRLDKNGKCTHCGEKIEGVF